MVSSLILKFWTDLILYTEIDIFPTSTLLVITTWKDRLKQLIFQIGFSKHFTVMGQKSLTYFSKYLHIKVLFFK